MEATSAALYGRRDMTGTLRRVLARTPQEDVSSWVACGWRAEPDPVGLRQEHEDFCSLLEEAGVEVVLAPPINGGNLDDVYAFDPAHVTDRGVVLLRPGKECRRGEPAALERDLEVAGVPVVGRLDTPAEAEGGDFIRLDDETLLAGHTYRTNAAGIAALAMLVSEVHAFDVPHLRGRTEILHLLSLLSPLDRDLAVAFVPLLPARLVQLLEEREVRLIEVPEEEFESMGPNVLALGPRRALTLEHNVETIRRVEAAGVDVVTYRADELSKGEGGATCLTLPLLRD